MVLRDLLKALEASPNDKNSLAKSMGLIFKVTGKDAGKWIEKGDLGTLKQRTQIGSTMPDSDVRPVKLFNPSRFDFGLNPPAFEKVKVYTDAGTIALGWDLTWPENGEGSGPQNDPDHHANYYMVRREPLDGMERALEYTVKPVSAMHKPPGKDKPLLRLAPRFNVVDHFPETPEDLASLPEHGRSYLYSITPVDLGGSRSPNPLVVVATRRPTAPPRVPTDAELLVRYEISQSDLSKNDGAVILEAKTTGPLPSIEVRFTMPAEDGNGPNIPIDRFELIFRREQALPIGNYALDSAESGARQ